MSQGSSLSVLMLEVLCGLQCLSPDVFQQVHFRPAKLLPSFHQEKEEEEGVRLALRININAFEENLAQVSW